LRVIVDGDGVVVERQGTAGGDARYHPSHVHYWHNQRRKKGIKSECLVSA
jgi:hypothetical protein